ncbi:MAG: sugar transferase [Desulfobacteraceae bacterium]|nr:sugar transferase [Desulfobacteraceae bacterium]
MNTDDNSIIIDFQKAVDILITSFSFIAAYFIKRNFLPEAYRELSIGPNYYIILLMIIISWFISFKLADMYISYQKSSLWNFFTRILKANFIGMLLLTIALYIIHITDISRLLLGIFLILNILLLLLFKTATYLFVKSLNEQGLSTINILIIGSGERARDVIQAINNDNNSSFRIVACLDIDPKNVGHIIFDQFKIVGTIDDLEQYLKDYIVDEIIFTVSLNEIQNPDQYFLLAKNVGVKIRMVPDWQLHYLMYQPGVSKVKFENFLGVYAISLQSTPHNEGMVFLKSLGDYIAGCFFLLISLPLFLFFTLAIKTSSKGPAFYKQERLGLNGRRFMVYKFRTMVIDAEELQKDLMDMNEADGPAFKIKKDPRIIPWVGTFLRKTNLDELPQLINVLKGEMSIVGPRPPIPTEVDEYSIWMRRRLSLKPGLTCYWQIAPNRNELSFDDWMKLDLEYIDTWSFFTDVKIILQTIFTVLKGSGR